MMILISEKYKQMRFDVRMYKDSSKSNSFHFDIWYYNIICTYIHMNNILYRLELLFHYYLYNVRFLLSRFVNTHYIHTSILGLKDIKK